MTVAEKIQERERALSRELISKHAGDWVAVCDHQIIAHATTPKDLDEQLSAEHRAYRTFRVSRGGGLTLLPAATP